MTIVHLQLQFFQLQQLLIQAACHKLLHCEGHNKSTSIGTTIREIRNFKVPNAEPME